MSDFALPFEATGEQALGEPRGENRPPLNPEALAAQLREEYAAAEAARAAMGKAESEEGAAS